MSAQTNALATRPISAPVALVDDWTQARIDFVLQTYCAGAPEPIADAFLHIARKRRLSPEEKHIYLVQYGKDWTIQTGIDGFRLIADRTEVYAGSDRPLFSGEPMTDDWEAEVTVWKIVQGVRCPFTATARYAEFVPPNPNQRFIWNRMPRLMLAKCAEAQALRKAFPADLSGIYVDAEMMQAEPATTATTVRETKPKAVPARSGSRQSDPNALASPEQIKALVDVGKRKRLGSDDVGILMGGEGWETRVTDGQARERLAWLQGATIEQIDNEMAAAMERMEADAAHELAEVDAAVDRLMTP